MNTPVDDCIGNILLNTCCFNSSSFVLSFRTLYKAEGLVINAKCVRGTMRLYVDARYTILPDSGCLVSHQLANRSGESIVAESITICTC